jgi:hypothetical protein
MERGLQYLRAEGVQLLHRPMLGLGGAGAIRLILLFYRRGGVGHAPLTASG